jgi:hypothetical protein
MSALFASIGFLHPWMLGALAALPALWWILRLMPPAPKHIIFAPIRFLEGLIPDRQTPSHTPWWILLLRCLIIALLIIGLAGPVRGKGEAVDNDTPIRIVIDNGWAAATLWDQQMRRAGDIINKAAQETQEIYIATTAPREGQDTPVYEGPLSAADAQGLVRALEPLPWASDNAALLALIKEKDQRTSITSYWLGDGIDEGHFDALASYLQDKGGLVYYTPDEKDLPAALKPDTEPEKPLSVTVDVPGSANTAHGMQAEIISTDGRVLDKQPLIVTDKGHDGRAAFDLPPALRNQVARIEISGRQSAASVILMDDVSRKHAVGVISSQDVRDSKPFIDALFYLSRALSPYADLSIGEAGDLIEQGQDILIMTDDAALPPSVLEQLDTWLNKGGLILRFAGPNMNDSENLTPVPLRKGQRALDGNLSWEKPQKIKSFPDGSPLADLPIAEDIIVKTQLLADPAYDLTGKVWATLEDGTPLITADTRGKGLLVMVHTAAAPGWSDLPLSGLYIAILRRIISLSGTTNLQETTSGQLKALSIMDGYGQLQEPRKTITVMAKDFSAATPGSHLPPGLYGRAGYKQALNLGDRLGPLKPIGALPAGAVEQPYDHDIQHNYMPLFLCAALCLFLVDWIIMIIMNGLWRGTLRVRQAAFVLTALALSPHSVHASDSNAIQYADEVHLAYVQTGHPVIDQTSQKGLETLAAVLSQRTSVEPAGVVAVRPDQDTLAFFPFIYWPISDDMPALNDQAVLNIQYYLDHGGTILFDTRGHTSGALQELLRPLSIPALVPITKDHVLNKTFYLIDSYPGRYNQDTLWVEENSTPGRDGVSSIIIGANDWAAAWSSPQELGVGQSYLTGQTREQEMSLRFGVNLALYALTGNYKADQVHLPHILQRLDQ